MMANINTVIAMISVKAEKNPKNIALTTKQAKCNITITMSPVLKLYAFSLTGMMEPQILRPPQHVHLHIFAK